MFLEILVKLIEGSQKLQHLVLESVYLQSRVTLIMWPIYRSKSLQAVHLNDNEIPDKIMSTVLEVFGI